MRNVKKLTRVERKMKRRRNFLKFILLILLISLGLVFVLKTNFFIIDKIEITGNNKIKREDLIIASSINIGENIFKISIKSGEENIRKLPYTEEIKIRRKLPKTIIIEIIECKEIAQIKDISSFLIIDNKGKILELKDDENENLPMIIGLEIDNKIQGDNIFSEMEFESKVEFIKVGHDIGILNEIKQIDMENIDSINIKTNDDISIAFGNLNNIRYKLNLLYSTLDYVKDEEISCTMILMDKGENPIIVTDEGG